MLKPVQKEVVTGWLKGQFPLQGFNVLTRTKENDDDALIVTEHGATSLVSSSFKRQRTSDEFSGTENPASAPTSKKRKRALSELIPSPRVLVTRTEEEAMLLTKDVPVYAIFNIVDNSLHSREDISSFSEFMNYFGKIKLPNTVGSTFGNPFLLHLLRLDSEVTTFMPRQ